MFSAFSTGKDAGEHRGDDGEVFGDVVGDGKGGERAAGHEELLADLDDFDELGGVGVEVDHVAGFLRGLRAGVHGDADVGLGEGRGIVGAVAGHGNELALALVRVIRSILSSGVASARKSSTPASRAMAAAVRGLSPVIMMVRMPMARSRAKRSLMPPLTMSLR